MVEHHHNILCTFEHTRIIIKRSQIVKCKMALFKCLSHSKWWNKPTHRIIFVKTESYLSKPGFCTYPVLQVQRFTILSTSMPSILIFTRWFMNICDRLCEKGSYSLSNCTCLTIHNLTCEYGTNKKFGHFKLLT